MINDKKKRPEGLQKRGSLSACLESRHPVAFNKNTLLSKQDMGKKICLVCCVLPECEFY